MREMVANLIWLADHARQIGTGEGAKRKTDSAVKYIEATLFTDAKIYYQ